MTIAILVCNIAVIICGMFFAPQLAWEISKRAILMGVVTAISVILLIVALCRKEFSGPAKTWLIISYIVAALVVFRWAITVYFVYA